MCSHWIKNVHKNKNNYIFEGYTAFTTKITLSCVAFQFGKNTKITVEKYNTTTTIIAGFGVGGNVGSMNGLCYCITQQFPY
jgi:hypothetical protein